MLLLLALTGTDRAKLARGVRGFAERSGPRDLPESLIGRRARLKAPRPCCRSGSFFVTS
jgi:hypothetical protein